MNADFEKLLIDESPDAIIATAPDGKVLYWNRSAELIFGFPRSEALGRTLNDLIVPPDRFDEEARIVREAIESAGATYESWRRRKDGSLVYVDISAKAVRDAAGHIRFILTSKKDVTHLQVQRGAKLLKARFGDLLESTPDAIVMANPAGRIVLANSQAEKVFGYASNEMLGLPVEALIPNRFHLAHVGHRASYFSQPRRREMGAGLELFGRRKDGTEFPVEISLNPLPTEEGMLVMSAVRDISERKRVQRELQEKNAQLEAANQELEAFSYSISHDLRAPVRAMAGFAKILTRQFSGQLPEESAHVLQRIRENAAKMGALIDGLLAFSGLSRQPMERSAVRPEAMVQSVVDELRPEFADRAVRIDIAPLPPCEADPTLLRQVFVNLLSNAIKYTRGRAPAEIKVGAQRQGEEVVYFVQDNGAGFDMEYAGKLFRVFQRLHTAEEFEGTGVGLAIVQRIVKRHGGRVWAEGAVDRGATFYFTLECGLPARE